VHEILPQVADTGQASGNPTCGRIGLCKMSLTSTDFSEMFHPSCAQDKLRSTWHGLLWLRWTCRCVSLIT